MDGWWWEALLCGVIVTMTVGAIGYGLWLGAPGQHFKKWMWPEGFDNEYFLPKKPPSSASGGSQEGGVKLIVREGRTEIVFPEKGSWSVVLWSGVFSHQP